MRIAGIVLLIGCTTTALSAARVDFSPERDRFAPVVQPELLFATILGGEGDQWFNHIGFKGDLVAAGNQDGLACVVTVGPDGTLEARAKGNPATPSKVDTSIPNGNRAGPFSCGYNQVHTILQQPWLKVGGRQLWGWSEQQAKSSSVKYAPFMADSRIRMTILAPNGHGLAIGTADGGNTSLRAHPADINQPMPMGVGYGITGGSGGGTSSWVFDISPQGEVGERAMVFRGFVVCAAWDEWGRVMVGGQGVIKSSGATTFGWHDGAGVLFASRDFSDCLFKAHFGKKEGGTTGGRIVSLAIDSERGLCAAAGYLEGDFEGKEALQTKTGGGKDAFFALWRLWTPEAYQAAIAAEGKAGE